MKDRLRTFIAKQLLPFPILIRIPGNSGFADLSGGTHEDLIINCPVHKVYTYKQSLSYMVIKFIVRNPTPAIPKYYFKKSLCL